MLSFRSFSMVCLFVSSALLVACSDGRSEQYAPKEKKYERADSRGSLVTGDGKGGGGFSLLGGESSSAEKASPIGVNSFLWRATLDTLSFMPFTSADPFGGVILTDWYEDTKTPGERFKVNALILDKTLRADGIKITVFKQKMDSKSKLWRDEAVDDKLARKLEDAVLTRARQLKVQSGKK